MGRNHQQKFPPIPKGKILELEASRKKRQEDNERIVNLYFDQLIYMRKRRSEARMSVLLAAIHHSGLPLPSEAEAFVTHAHGVADMHVLPEMQGDSLKLKEILAELKVKDLPGHMVWAARQMGVELFDGEPETLPGELPKSEAPSATPVGDDVDVGEHAPGVPSTSMIITDPRG